MNGALLLVAFLSLLGGLLIRDARAFLLFAVLSAAAAFLLAFLVDPQAPLGLLGLAVPAFAVLRRLRRERVLPSAPFRPRTYRSSSRLERLEEVAVSIPEHIVDVVPAGSARRIHPRLVELAQISVEAASRGYSVEEPPWFSAVRRYLTWVGPELRAERTRVISEFEIVEL